MGSYFRRSDKYSVASNIVYALLNLLLSSSVRRIRRERLDQSAILKIRLTWYPVHSYFNPSSITPLSSDIELMMDLASSPTDIYVSHGHDVPSLLLILFATCFCQRSNVLQNFLAIYLSSRAPKTTQEPPFSLRRCRET
jgi:hypothetical protein